MIFRGFYNDKAMHGYIGACLFKLFALKLFVIAPVNQETLTVN
jgi:hypothetical protein